MSSLNLLTVAFSPYGQRVETLLLEKNISYNKEQIDLGNKPNWFSDISPLGKIPVLLVDDKPLFESLAILEYIEATYTETIFHPKNQFVLAWHRGWMEFSNTLLSLTFGLVFADNAQTISQKQEELKNKLALFAKQLKQQPYFNGDFFSILDITMASAMQPLLFLSENFNLNLFENLDNLLQYANNVVSRPNFIKSLPENYSQIFENFLKRKNSFLLQL
jgi:glutathione S-transferase